MFFGLYETHSERQLRYLRVSRAEVRVLEYSRLRWMKICADKAARVRELEKQNLVLRALIEDIAKTLGE